MPLLKKLALGAAGATALATALTVAPAGGASANSPAYYDITCFMQPPGSSVAGACLEFSNGVWTYYGFDWNGNYWIINQGNY